MIQLPGVQEHETYVGDEDGDLDPPRKSAPDSLLGKCLAHSRCSVQVNDLKSFSQR